MAFYTAGGKNYNYTDPSQEQQGQQISDQESLAQAGALGHLNNSLESEAGQNKNAALIGSLPAYGTAMGTSQSNQMGASQAARMQSLQALLKLVGF